MPSREQYEKAIALAQRAGDEEAAQALIQEAAGKVTGEGSFMEKLGAGVEDIRLGAKQLFGGDVSPDQVREHNRIAKQATGGKLSGELVRALPLATAAFIPGGQSVVGASLIGAGSGLLMPTEDENVVGGKVKQAVLGGVTGGALQKGMNVAAPYVGKVLKSAGNAVTDRLPGGADRAAERAFVEQIPDAAARTTAANDLRTQAAMRTSPPAVGSTGAPISAGSATKNPALLAAEREAHEVGGALGQPLREMYDTANTARWQHLEQNVGGDMKQLSQNADDIYQNMILNAKLNKPFDPKDRVWNRIQKAIADEDNPSVRGELERLRDQFASAKNRGTVEALHKVRKEAIGDLQRRLYQSDSNAAKGLRNTIEEIEKLFDAQMSRSIGGTIWADFLTEFRDAATARSQGKAGNKVLEQLGNLNEAPGGAPNLVGQRRALATAADKTTKTGDPALSQDARDALEAVRREIGEERLPFTSQGTVNSATAQNQNPRSPVLARAIAGQRRQSGQVPQGLSDIGAYALGSATGGDPVSGLGLALARRGLVSAADRRAIDIAQRMIQLHLDLPRAAALLEKANVPSAIKQKVLAHLQQAQRAVTPMAAGAAAGNAGDMRDY